VRSNIFANTLKAGKGILYYRVDHNFAIIWLSTKLFHTIFRHPQARDSRSATPCRKCATASKKNWITCKRRITGKKEMVEFLQNVLGLATLSVISINCYKRGLHY